MQYLTLTELRAKLGNRSRSAIYLDLAEGRLPQPIKLGGRRNTVGTWFQTLEQRGFIALTVAPHLGPSGIGKASKWRLEELPTPDGKPATKRFTQWREKQKTRTKNRTPRHNKQDTQADKGRKNTGKRSNKAEPS